MENSSNYNYMKNNHCVMQKLQILICEFLNSETIIWHIVSVAIFVSNYRGVLYARVI